MSRVSERVLDASPPDDREVRSLLLAVLARLRSGRSEVSPRPAQRVAPSLAMSTDVAEERDSQPAQRDELAHSHIVPTRGGVLPPANVPSPAAITEITGSQHAPLPGYRTIAVRTTAYLATCFLGIAKSEKENGPRHTRPSCVDNSEFWNFSIHAKYTHIKNRGVWL